jgi:hypothetical protein
MENVNDTGSKNKSEKPSENVSESEICFSFS